ncbi:hypothetical protein KC845_02880 [Candidatus Kaiserbacteria bacterium]|nr:hypothetical protein [Candidatus Kaiserbacteria bacterium]
MRYIILTVLLATAPLSVLAADSIDGLVNKGTGFIGGVLIYFLLGLATIVFLFNVTRYFIIGSGDEQGRTKAKTGAMYGIAAFVLISIMWGIVNFLVNGLGLNNSNPIKPDYNSEWELTPYVDE